MDLIFKVINDNTFQRTTNEAFVISFKLLPRHLPRRTEEKKLRLISNSSAAILPEIRTGHLAITNIF